VIVLPMKYGSAMRMNLRAKSKLSVRTLTRCERTCRGPLKHS